MIRRPKVGLYSNEHVNKVFFMVKSFITFYLIQYQKNAFHDEQFLSVYSILQIELYLPGLVKNRSQISASGCLVMLTKKIACLEKKNNF